MFKTKIAIVRITLGAAAATTWAAWWWCTAELEPRPVLLVSLWLATLCLWALALFSRWPMRKPGQATVTSVAIIMLGLIPRGLSLGEAPYQIASDEVVHPLLGMGILQGDFWRLIAGLSDSSYIVGSAYPTQLLQTWPILFCEPLFGARLASLVLSVVSLLGTYALASSGIGRLRNDRPAVLPSAGPRSRRRASIGHLARDIAASGTMARRRPRPAFLPEWRWRYDAE